jgi:hypothetical protein
LEEAATSGHIVQVPFESHVTLVQESIFLTTQDVDQLGTKRVKSITHQQWVPFMPADELVPCRARERVLGHTLSPGSLDADKSARRLAKPLPAVEHPPRPIPVTLGSFDSK